MNYLIDYDTAERIREATEEEVFASARAAENDDNGQGVIMVDGRRCYVWPLFGPKGAN